MRTRAAALLAVAVVLGAAACGRGTTPSVVEGGDPARGHDLIEQIGCGACHVIGGVANANGHVGPNLENWDQRHTIGGVLPNTTDNLVKWLMDPPSVSPKTTMPDLGISRSQALDIAAYLYAH